MDVVVVGVVMPIVLMAVPFSVAVVALMEEEGEHTQETELGVHVDSHCPLTSGPHSVPLSECEIKLAEEVNDGVVTEGCRREV